MKRFIFNELEKWFNSPLRKPLLLRGARQIGKTHCVREFAKSHFENLVEINFELEPDYIQCFSELDPQKIIQKLHLASSTNNIYSGKTLLFLDEIQDCPQAIMALRYFKELMPDLHVIAAGSLLEFALKREQFRMPVGRVEYRYMYPMTFREYLWAMKENKLCEFLTSVNVGDDFPRIAHQKLCEYFRRYLVLGGMPEVIAAFRVTQDYQACRGVQTALLNTYRNDFGKYSKLKDLPIIEELFRKAPELIGQQFKYTQVNPDYRSRELKVSLEHLISANLLMPVYATSASGLPLHAGINRMRFKINFLDVGLVNNVNKMNPEVLLQEDFFALNRGAVMEQVVGQELMAYGESTEAAELYFWVRDNKSRSKAEIDYVMQVDDQMIPIEVKAGKTGRLRSLQLFLQEKKLPFGVRISLHPLGIEQNILSIPAYMIAELPRLVKQKKNYN